MLTVIRDKGASAKPTHIMYKSNLSHKMLITYLDELILKGFVEATEEKDQKKYLITDKGLNYLRDYRSVQNFIDSFGLDE